MHHGWATPKIIIGSGVLLSIGDLISQKIEYNNETLTSTKRFDWTRNVRMFAIGLALGPLHHCFYGRLNRVFCGPMCLVTFFGAVTWLNKNNIGECTKELKMKFERVIDWTLAPNAPFTISPVCRQTIVSTSSISYQKKLRIITPVHCVNEEEEAMDRATTAALTKKLSDNNINISVKYTNRNVFVAAQAMELYAKCIDVYIKHKDAIDHHAPLLEKLSDGNIELSMDFLSDPTIAPFVLELLNKCIDLYTEYEKEIDGTVGQIVPLVEELLDICVDLYENHRSEIFAAIGTLIPLLERIDRRLQESEQANWH